MPNPDYQGPIHVEMVVPEGSPIGYSDFVHAQRHSFGVTISFFQMHLPTFDKETDLANFRKNPTVKAYCVARLVVPTEQASRLAEALRSQLPAPSEETK
ncbi:MAG TPA: hypothetical protein VKU61_11075 [Candidatus Binatia bacterium]|nr:hypothetical protein [Candidatus Binatia bacterium]